VQAGQAGVPDVDVPAGQLLVMARDCFVGCRISAEPSAGYVVLTLTVPTMGEALGSLVKAFETSADPVLIERFQRMDIPERRERTVRELVEVIDRLVIDDLIGMMAARRDGTS